MTEHPRTTRILGIDPGLNTTGYGVIEAGEQGIHLVEAGVVRSRAKDSLPARLEQLHRGVADVMQSLQPTAMGLEQLYSNYRHPRTAILMGHARGVICLAAAMANVPVNSYAATKVKRILTGSGRASKGQVQIAIRRELSLAEVPEPPDVADALAIALCCWFVGDESEATTQAATKQKSSKSTADTTFGLATATPSNAYPQRPIS